MGYAIAEAARDRGAHVTLVSTTDALDVPYGVELVPVETVEQMRDAVVEACKVADALIMAAAVSDFRPVQVAEQKIKKGEAPDLEISLVKTASVLAAAPDDIVKVAFAAETDEVLENARRKPLTHGRLDLICANDVSAADAGFGTDTNRVTIIDAQGSAEELPLLSKYEVGMRILDRVLPLIEKRRG
jgi:phosphopantothenoylcysteine decarboxylase/phosphopantothenate--cysteine ligase